MNAPSKIWINAAGKEAPDWIVERMTTADIAADGSFEIETGDGPVTVERGHAVFEFNDQVYACQPRLVQDKLAAAAGAENAVVAELSEKTEKERQRQAANHADRKLKRNVLDDGYQLKLKPIVGAPPVPAFVPPSDLLVDDTYQRSIEGGASRKLIIKIAENWDWRLCLPLLVSRRDGKLFVIDGQHRKEAADLRGDVPHLPVIVFDFDDPKAEAELFVAANRSRRAMSPLDDFHAAIVAGDAKAVAINDVVTEAGLAVGRIQAWQYWQPGEVTFVSTIRRVLNGHGKVPTIQALSILARAFEGQTLVSGGSIFEAVAEFSQERAQDGKPIDPALMEAVLANVGIPGWKEAVEGVDSASERADAMLKAVAEAYVEAEAE